MGNKLSKSMLISFIVLVVMGSLLVMPTGATENTYSIETDTGKLSFSGTRMLDPSVPSGDSAGKDYVLVIYNYENYTVDPKSPTKDFWPTVYQNGVELDTIHNYNVGSEDCELLQDSFKTVIKGGVLEFGRAYELTDDGPLTVVLKQNGNSDVEPVSFEVDINSETLDEESSDSLSVSSTEKAITNNDYQIGDSVSTDMVEFTLNECLSTEVVSLEKENWLRPGYEGGTLSAGDNQEFVFFDSTIKNMSPNRTTATDLADVSVRYLDKYNYEDVTYSDEVGWSSDSALSKKVGMRYIEPLTTVDVIGFIKCAKELRDNPNDVVLVVKLASENGEEEYHFHINYDGFTLSTDASAETSALLDAMDIAESKFEFVEEYAGGTNGKGSRKFADSFIEEMETSLEGISVSTATEQIPNLDTAVKALNEKVKSVVGLLVDMGVTNSDSNVPQMKEISNSAIQDIRTIRDAINGNPEAIAKLGEIQTVYTDQEIIQKVQEALNAAGYDCGTPDGKAGDKTHAALNAYQEANGLIVQNDITDELLNSLGI